MYVDAALGEIMYFGNRQVTLWYRGGHQTLLMATIDGINFTLDDDKDMDMLRDWAHRLRQDSSATL